MKKVENHVLEGALFATFCRNIEHFLCGVLRLKRFVYVRLRCIVRNLKRISKMSILPPLGKKFCGRPCFHKFVKSVVSVRLNPCPVCI